jgi:hypothetical protein
VLGTVKDGHLRLPPLRGAYGILDRPCAPLPSEGVGTGSVPNNDHASGGSNRKLRTGHIAVRSSRMPFKGAMTDSALTPFLALLEADLVSLLGEGVHPLPQALEHRLNALAAEVGEVDPTAPIGRN